jgi:hypothetical protein
MNSAEFCQSEWPYMDSSSLTSERWAKSKTTALVYPASLVGVR